MDKNTDAIVIHLPADKRKQFERIAERRGEHKSRFEKLGFLGFQIQEKRSTHSSYLQSVRQLIIKNNYEKPSF